MVKRISDLLNLKGLYRKYMSNLLNENKLVIFARSLSFSSRFLITISLFGIAIFIWFILFYLPLHNKIKNQELYVNNLLEYQSTSLYTLSIFDEVKRKNDFLINQKRGFVERQIQSSYNLNIVLNLLEKNSLEFQEILPLECSSNGFYKEEYYHFKVFGDFSNLLNFLHELEKFCKNIQFKIVTLESKGDRGVLLETKLKLIKFVG